MTTILGKRGVAVAALAALALVALAAAMCSRGEDAGEPERAATEPPAITEWTDIHGIAVPLSADGPENQFDATGFTRTPQGAALAAIWQSVRLSTANDQEWSKLVPAITAPTPGRNTWIGQRLMLSVTGDVDPGMAPTILGYRITAYSDTDAVIGVVQQFPDGPIAEIATPVTWLATGAQTGGWVLTLEEPDSTPAVALHPAPPADTIILDRTNA